MLDQNVNGNEVKSGHFFVVFRSQLETIEAADALISRDGKLLIPFLLEILHCCAPKRVTMCYYGPALVIEKLRKTAKREMNFCLISSNVTCCATGDVSAHQLFPLMHFALFSSRFMFELFFCSLASVTLRTVKTNIVELIRAKTKSIKPTSTRKY